MNADVLKFAEACRDHDCDFYELHERSWSKPFNSVNLHDLHYENGVLSVIHNVCGQIFTYDLTGIREIAFGQSPFSTAITLTLKDNRYILLHRR